MHVCFALEESTNVRTAKVWDVDFFFRFPLDGKLVTAAREEPRFTSEMSPHRTRASLQLFLFSRRYVHKCWSHDCLFSFLKQKMDSVTDRYCSEVKYLQEFLDMLEHFFREDERVN